jgi:regulator of sigma E protease
VLLGFIALTQLGKIAIFVATLSILVVLHEYGHFLIARRNGVRVNEFAVGMGPKIFGWTSPRSGTLYSFRALPIGGFCAMEGEDNKTSEAEQQREFIQAPVDNANNFQAKSPWSRLAIVLAGPIANFILCYVILLIAALTFGAQGDTPEAVVGPLVGGSPGQIAGLHAGDRIVELNGKSIKDGTQLVGTIHASLGKQLDLVYARDGTRTEVFLKTMPCPQDKKLGCIGFSPIGTFHRVGFVEAFVVSGRDFVGIADQTVGNLVLLATHFSTYASQVSGPIGMGQAATAYQDFGWGLYLRFAALISFALGVFNLLPLPALDGGRAAFIVAELIRGKPVDPEREAVVHIAGFAALMALMLVIALHDVTRIVSGHGVFN